MRSFKKSEKSEKGKMTEAELLKAYEKWIPSLLIRDISDNVFRTKGPL